MTVAKLDSSEIPPLSYSPLFSERGRESTADSTPISTPIVGQQPSPSFGRPKRERDLYFSWHRKPLDQGGVSSATSHLDSDLLFPDTIIDDDTFPLFPETSPPLTAMANHASPIDISTPPRYGSNSPRNQTSNLTSALQQAGASGLQPAAIDISGNSGDYRVGIGGRHDSISNGAGSYHGTGARPIINPRDRPRRESNTGSFVNGMSWGGASVGSFIRDEIMTGTSPFPHQSPSFQSSSYLPKMEAAFMRDFSCCGITLDSLHELLQHFEEAHAQPSKETTQKLNTGNPRGSMSSESATVAPGNAAAVQQQAQQQHAANQQQGIRNQNSQSPAQTFRHQQMGSDGFNRTSLPTVQDVDELEDMDMDMDDADEPPTPQQQHFSQSQFSQPGSRSSLNLNMTGTMQHGLRTSAPTTPMASQSGFQYQNNPTVSSVNTPALSTQSLQLGSSRTPDSSVPGTPAELDMDETGNFMGRLPGQTTLGQNAGMDWSSLGNLTIDEPAKRLISKGGMNNQQLQAAAMAQGNFANNSEMARKFQEQQILNGGTINPLGFPPEEVKPFKCPVIGCEKAYKNQNGLKYHKSHGHRSQKLKENPDGTFSIVDPETSIPYPGTVGMEKEKPYRCETCGKRYKNLNGLKYHRQHSPACNPDLKLPLQGLPTNLQGIGVNVAGAGTGLSGMGGDGPLF